MIFQILVVIVLLVIIYCLGSGLFYLVRQEEKDTERIAKALTWRIVLSLLLFAFLITTYFLGWTHPHGI